MRIALITDAWHPQINGVVRTLSETVLRLEALGHDVLVINPDGFRQMPMPGYPEIRLALATAASVGKSIANFEPDGIHIATEGPLGLAARRWCKREGQRFTTAFHTHFPDYIARRTRLPAGLFWPAMRRFHRAAEHVLVSTESVRVQLRAQGIDRLSHWGRGVDLDQFSPDAPEPPEYAGLPRPIRLYVGRVAVEKNIEAFLALPGPGSTVVVGDGPARERLEALYPQAHFLGARQGQALAGCYAHADVMVFPSRTDTFGLVMIEALATGTPVAAYPVQGPLDVLDESCGAMDGSLARATEIALTRSRAACRSHAQRFTWERSVADFLSAIVPANKAQGEIFPAIA